MTRGAAPPLWLSLLLRLKELALINAASSSWDVYVVTDLEPEESGAEEELLMRDELEGRIHEVRVSSQSCRGAGFSGCNTAIFEKTPIAWDKALFFFADRRRGVYEHVWFLEDDVLLGSAAALLDLDARLGGLPDLVCAPTTDAAMSESWSHWRPKSREPAAEDVFPGSPRSRLKAMVCVARMSTALLAAISNHAQIFGRLHFLEYLFPTIAVRARLRVATDVSLRRIRWRFDGDDLRLALTSMMPSDLLHPVKDQAAHACYRAAIAQALRN